MVMAAAIALATGDAWAQEPTRQELRRVFEQLLRDPTNTELNLRYAILARERGELRKALATYERMLATDPDNEEAQEGIRRVRLLLKPDVTEITVLIGGEFQTNPKYEVDSDSGTDDGILVGQLLVTDRRNLGETRWRTDGDIYSNWHAKFGDIDYLSIGVQTGPVFELAEGWDIRPAVGVSYAILDRDPFFYEGSFSLSIESTEDGTFQSLNFRGAYDDIDSEVAGANAYFLEINPRFVFSDLFTESDQAVLNPLYRYNGVRGSGTGTGINAETFPLRYHVIGARADYVFPITEEIYGGLNFTASYEIYNERVAGKTNDRRDIYLVPGARIIIARVFNPRHDIVIGYQYERNLSNDKLETFENHTARVRSVWRF